MDYIYYIKQRFYFADRKSAFFVNKKTRTINLLLINGLRLRILCFQGKKEGMYFDEKIGRIKDEQQSGWAALTKYHKN